MKQNRIRNPLSSVLVQGMQLVATITIHADKPSGARFEECS